MQQAHPAVGQRVAQQLVGCGGVLQVQRLRLFDQRTDPVDLPALRHLLANPGDHGVPPGVGEQLGEHRRAAGRQLVDGADVEVGKERHRQGARDRRGAHHERVRLDAAVLQLGAQGQPLLHAKAVLLVDDGQAEPRKIDLVLDHRVRADHQRRFARGHLGQHLLARLAFAAAAEPRHVDAQRREPAHQLAQMLLGQDFGRGHQRALPAGFDGQRGGQRRDHGLARTHVALQQAVHRHLTPQVVRDFVADPALGGGQRKRQGREQAFPQPARLRQKRRRALQLAFALGLQLRQLLRQQLLELQALPGRVAVVLQRRLAHVGGRVVQEVQRLAQAHHAGGHHASRQHLGQVGARQAAGHGLAQVGLRQLGAGRVDRCQRAGQRRVAVDTFEAGVHHLQPEKPAARLTPNPDPAADRQRLLVRRIEVQEAQHQVGVVVAQPHDQLAPRAKLHLAVADHAFDLGHVTVAQRRNGRDAGLVLIAQRQVQRQVDVAQQAEFFQRLLRAGLRCGGGGRGVGHASILAVGHAPHS